MQSDLSERAFIGEAFGAFRGSGTPLQKPIH
jgi:hypothetical protein